MDSRRALLQKVRNEPVVRIRLFSIMQQSLNERLRPALDLCESLEYTVEKWPQIKFCTERAHCDACLDV